MLTTSRVMSVSSYIYVQERKFEHFIVVVVDSYVKVTVKQHTVKRPWLGEQSLVVCVQSISVYYNLQCHPNWRTAKIKIQISRFTLARDCTAIVAPATVQKVVQLVCNFLDGVATAIENWQDIWVVSRTCGAGTTTSWSTGWSRTT